MLPELARREIERLADAFVVGVVVLLHPAVDLLAQLLDRGIGAEQQRCWARNGDLSSVVRRTAELTAS